MFNKFFKSVFVGLASLSLATTGFTFTANAQEENLAEDQSISMMTIGELATMDSMLYNDTPSCDMIGHIFEGLYRYF